MSTLPIIGLMLGDMTGIGPEISARMLASGTMKSVARIVIIGDARVLELGCRDAGVDIKSQRYANVDAIDWSRGEVPLIDLGNIDPSRFRRGEVSARARPTPARSSMRCALPRGSLRRKCIDEKRGRVRPRRV